MSAPETFLSGATSVPIEVFVPDKTARRRAVLILHGSAGLGPAYRADIVSFAHALGKKGIAATLPHYFASSPPLPGEDPVSSIANHYAPWRQASRDALAFMAGDPRFDPARLAVIGFSLGAHFALAVALDAPKGVTLKCVVDFFGPTVMPPLNGRFERMPPVLIHHGTDDTTVFPQESTALVEKLEEARKRAGRDYVFEKYPKQTHHFDAATLATARATTVGFVDSRL